MNMIDDGLAGGGIREHEMGCVTSQPSRETSSSFCKPFACLGREYTRKRKGLFIVYRSKDGWMDVCDRLVNRGCLVPPARVS